MKYKKSCNIYKRLPAEIYIESLHRILIKTETEQTFKKREEVDSMQDRVSKQKMYVDAAEICEDWGVSKSQAYKIIRSLNEKMLAMNPNLIVLSGKANRKFYEENCYGKADG